MARVLAVSEWRAEGGVAESLRAALTARSVVCKAMDVRYWVFAESDRQVVEFVEGTSEHVVHAAVERLRNLGDEIGATSFRYLQEVEQ